MSNEEGSVLQEYLLAIVQSPDAFERWLGHNANMPHWGFLREFTRKEKQAQLEAAEMKKNAWAREHGLDLTTQVGRFLHGVVKSAIDELREAVEDLSRDMDRIDVQLGEMRLAHQPGGGRNALPPACEQEIVDIRQGG